MSRGWVVLWVASVLFGAAGWGLIFLVDAQMKKEEKTTAVANMLPSKSVSMFDPNYIEAKGSLVSTTALQEVASSWNTVEITCWKPDRRCHFAQAEIKGGSLLVYATNFNAISWDPNGRVRALDSSPICANQVLFIDVELQEVRLARIKKEDAHLPVMCDALLSRFDMRLVDGNEVTSALQ